jgi:protein-histidine pros-kinase
MSLRAILVVNGRSGKVIKANQRSEILFGYNRSELIGMPVELLLPADKRTLHVKQRVGFLRSIRKREIGYHPPIFALRKDGSQVELIVGLNSTTATEDVMVICSPVAEFAELGTSAGSDTDREEFSSSQS